MAQTYLGNAAVTTLAADINATDTILTFANASSWDSGNPADSIVIRITRDSDGYQEKMLGTYDAVEDEFVVNQRGYDGTTASTFSTGDVAEHVLDAATMVSIRSVQDTHESYFNSTFLPHSTNSPAPTATWYMRDAEIVSSNVNITPLDITAPSGQSTDIVRVFKDGYNIFSIESDTSVFMHDNQFQFSTTGAGTSEDRSFQIFSLGRASISLWSDKSNSSGEPGGAYVLFGRDGTTGTNGPYGIVGTTQNAGELPDGKVYAGLSEIAPNQFIIASNDDVVLYARNEGGLRLTGTHFVPETDGYIGLGTSGLRFDDIWIADADVNGSDRRLKDDIETTELGLEFIKKLRPRQYRWKGKTRTHQGLVAQEVKETLDALGVDSAMYVDPSLEPAPVREDFDNKDDYRSAVKMHKLNIESALSLRYTELIAPLIKAVQELSAEVEALRAS